MAGSATLGSSTVKVAVTDSLGNTSVCPSWTSKATTSPCSVIVIPTFFRSSCSTSGLSSALSSSLSCFLGFDTAGSVSSVFSSAVAVWAFCSTQTPSLLELPLEYHTKSRATSSVFLEQLSTVFQMSSRSGSCPSDQCMKHCHFWDFSA